MKNSRRYYLHRKIKDFFPVNARKRQIDITEHEFNESPPIFKATFLN